MPARTALARSLTLLLALAPFAAEPTARLDRITVSASTTRLPDSESALPNTVTVITREELDRQLAFTHDLSQILGNLVPAFSPARQKLTNFGESLRGRKPLYMIDGVPQSTPLRSGAREAHTIDPALIERIEIIHGANALQGIGASGGIINIITKRAPETDGRFHDLRLAANAALPRRRDDAGGRGAYLYGWRAGQLDLIAGASYGRQGLSYDGEGRPLYIESTQGDLMDARQWDLFAKIGRTLTGGGRLQLMLNRYRQQGDGDYRPVPGDLAANRPASAVRGRPEGTPPNNRVDSASLDLSLPEIAGGALQAQVFWLDFAALYGGGRFASFQDPALPPDWFDQSQNVSQKVGSKLDWTRRELFGLPLRLRLGFDTLRDRTYQSLVHSGRLWVPETVYESLAPFAQAEWWPAEPLMLVAGLRHERGRLVVDDYRTLAYYGGHLVEGGRPKLRETLPNLGAVWHLHAHLNVYASYAEGFTVADIGRVLRAIDAPGYRVEQLIDLRPVIADNRELGLDYDDGRLSTHLAYYESDSDFGSLLVYDAVNNVYNVQRQATAVHGFEGQLAWRPAAATRLGVAYARTRGRYDSDGDGRLDSDLEGINIAPDRVNLFWEQAWGAHVDTRLQASRFQSRDFFRHGTPVANFDGYATLDLFLRWRTGIGDVSLGIENLGDRQYLTYHSQTTASVATWTAGHGRNLTLSWQRRF